MIFVIIVLGGLLFFILLAIFGALTSIGDTLKNVMFKDLQFQCPNPSDHYHFKVGDNPTKIGTQNADGTWTYKTTDES